MHCICLGDELGGGTIEMGFDNVGKGSEVGLKYRGLHSSACREDFPRVDIEDKLAKTWMENPYT